MNSSSAVVTSSSSSSIRNGAAITIIRRMVMLLFCSTIITTPLSGGRKAPMQRATAFLIANTHITRLTKAATASTALCSSNARRSCNSSRILSSLNHQRRSFHTTKTKLWEQKQKQGGGGGGRVSASIQDKNIIEKTDNSSSSRDKKKKIQQQQKAKPNNALDTNPPKGTRDFYPEDMRVRNWLFGQWRNVASTYGFVEYDAPVLESESLYTRKAGEEVTQQLYNFVDKGERNVALRPEMTPSLARMVMSKKGSLPLPIKWFSIPQCWRYERMTRGRRREHFQWNMDIWGVAGVEAEAELLSAMVSFFKAVGLSSGDVGIKINSRLVIGEVLTELGIPPEKFAATCVLVDKLEKVPLDAIQDELEEIGLDRAVVERLTAVLTVDSIDGIRNLLGDDSDAVQQISQLIDLCKSYDISDWIIFDASIVRGLAYYTGVVFEAFDRKGVLRAIAGGGRYDKLLETFGGEPTPAAGFGFGDAVILELLKDRNILPSFDSSGIDTVVFAMSPNEYPGAIYVAQALRTLGQKVELVLEKDKRTKWVFKHASRLGARYCAIIGSEEYENDQVSIKDLADFQQRTVSISELSSWVTAEEDAVKDSDN